MIQPLTVVYLHTPSDEDATILQDMEYGLSDAFRAFCREVFAYDAPFDFPRLKLVTAATPKELDALLFGVENERHFVSDAYIRYVGYVYHALVHADVAGNRRHDSIDDNLRLR